MSVTKEATEEISSVLKEPLVCLLVVRRIKVEGKNIESGASTSLQTPNKKRKYKRTAVT
jgi:hypothetical protein